jgi:hypothetical protein
MIDKGMMVLQNNTNVEEMAPGSCGGTYATSEDANERMGIKAEEVPEVKKEEYHVPITFQKIKADPEVSYMSLYVLC